MDAKKDYYAVLGVDPSATVEQLRSAWRTLMETHHPDLWRASGQEREREATRRTQEINEAWQILSDEQGRLEYDKRRTLHLLQMVSWRPPSFAGSNGVELQDFEAPGAPRSIVPPEEFADLMSGSFGPRVTPVPGAPPPDGVTPADTGSAPPTDTAVLAPETPFPMERTPWSLRTILYVFGMTVLLSIPISLVIGGIIGATLYAPDSELTDREVLILSLAVQGFIDAAAVVAIYAFGLRPRGLDLRALGLRGFGWRGARYVVAGLVVAWGALIAYGLIVELLGLDFLVPQSTVPSDEEFFDEPITIILGAILILGFAPVTEEMFFRGFVFPGLVPRFGFVWAGLMSGVAFAALHVDVGSMVPFTAIGFILAWLYRQTGTLWTPIAMHLVFNAVSFAILVGSDVT